MRTVASSTNIAHDILETPAPRPQSDTVFRFGDQDLAVALQSASLHGTVAATRTLDQGSYGSLRIVKGAPVDLWVDGSTATLQVGRDGMVLDLNWGPNVTLKSISYDLKTGLLDIDASGPGPDFIYRWIANSIANQHFHKLLPTPMTNHGIQPDAVGSVPKGLMDLVTALLTGRGGPTGVVLNNPEIHVDLGLEESVGRDLPNDMRLVAPSGTYSVDASFETGSGNGVLRSLTVNAPSGSTIDVLKTKGTFSSLSGIRIASVTIRPGGQVSARYTLTAEEALNGGESLFRLLLGGLAIAGGDGRGVEILNAPAPDNRMEAVRRDVDAKLSQEVGPLVARWVAAHEDLLPGLSLHTVMGLPQP